jgi:hypothetical protein
MDRIENGTNAAFTSINAPIYKGVTMASNTSGTMIAALQVSLDGFIEGPHGEKD